MKTKGKPDKPRIGRPPRPVEPKTEGQRQLVETGGGEAEIAARVGCGAAVVGHWRRGRRVPGEAHRRKLELLFGIPARAWDVAPGALPAPGPAAAPPGDPAAPLDDAGTLEIAKAQIDAILKELEKADTLTDGAAAKLRDTLAKLLALRARLERDRDLQEDRLVREHPEWARTKARILDALRPFPEAARAVAEALE